MEPGPVVDRDEWLDVGASWDEVGLSVLGDGWALHVQLVVRPHGRTAGAALVESGGATTRLDDEEDGPPTTNWDRMDVGRVRWRMVEALVRWDAELGGPGDALRGYVAFTGEGPCPRVAGGYVQAGRAEGELVVDGRRLPVAAPAVRRRIRPR